MRLYFDIETGPRQEGIGAFYEPPLPFDPSAVKLGNRSDPDTISSYLEEKRQEWAASAEAHREKFVERAALDPRTARILTIQYGIGDGPSEIQVIQGEETLIIERFLGVARDADSLINWTGHNKSGNWDLNMICRRGWALGLTVDAWGLKRKSRDLADSFMVFSDWGSFCGLDKAVKELGGPVYSGPCEGARFSEFYESDREEALRYARSDVVALQFLNMKINE